MIWDAVTFLTTVILITGILNLTAMQKFVIGVTVTFCWQAAAAGRLVANNQLFTELSEIQVPTASGRLTNNEV